MTKAQTQQVFLYLLAAIMIGVIVLIGYKSITTVTTHSCEAQKIEFMTTLRDIAETNHVYGVRKLIKIQPPCGYSTLCIINSSSNRGNKPLNMPSILDTAWRNGVAQNIYISRSGTHNLEALGTIDYFATPKGFVCINTTNGLFQFIVEGTGRYALIK